MNVSIKNFALIIGAHKCGTSSLFYYLSEHPQICASRLKEPHFFAVDKQFAKGITWYQSLWQWQTNHQIALEASTKYTAMPHFPNVVKRISQIKDADFRFIYIMRHPLHRLESSIRQSLVEIEMKNLSLSPLEELRMKEKILNISKYAMQVDTYVKVFGRDKLHLLLLEDLKNNPQAELRRICQFLQIDSDYQFKNIDVIRNSRETHNLHPFLHKLRHRPLIQYFLKNFTSPRLRQKLRRKLSRKDSLKIQLSQQDKEIFLKQLQPDLARLEAEYGIDVQGKWGLSVGSCSNLNS